MLNEHIGHLDAQQVFNMIYPVGSIYMSVNSTSPSILFGGTWEQIEDTFLLAAGSTFTAGDAGGAINHTPSGNLSETSITPSGTLSGGAVGNHTLTVAEMPSHSHRVRREYGTGSNLGYGPPDGNYTQFAGPSAGTQNWSSNGVEATGSGGAHNHPFTQPTFTGTAASHGHTFTGTSQDTMPPYLAVYCWKRTA